MASYICRLRIVLQTGIGIHIGAFHNHAVALLPYLGATLQTKTKRVYLIYFRLSAKEYGGIFWQSKVVIGKILFFTETFKEHFVFTRKFLLNLTGIAFLFWQSFHILHLPLLWPLQKIIVILTCVHFKDFCWNTPWVKHKTSANRKQSPRRIFD